MRIYNSDSDGMLILCEECVEQGMIHEINCDRSEDDRYYLCKVDAFTTERCGVCQKGE